MNFLVLGAGVIGLTTAWALTEAGCQVTIIDRNPAPGGDASAGNGAQLSYNFVAPFASPDTLKHLPALLLQRDGPTRFRPGLDPDLARWGAAFLRHCTTNAVRHTTIAQLALAAASRAEMDRLNATIALDFGLRAAGKLVLYRAPSAFAAARRQAARQQGLGSEQQILTAHEALTLEPGLRIPASDLAGGVYTPSDQVGDCALFCRGLAGHLRTRNTVEWQLGAACEPLMRDGQVIGARVGNRDFEADQTILCLGAGATAFARAAGLRLPIYPMKGYSLTLQPRTPLAHSVTDMDRKLVFAPLPGPMIRVAGIADFVGHDRRLDPARLAAMTRAATAALDVDITHGTQPLDRSPPRDARQPPADRRLQRAGPVPQHRPWRPRLDPRRRQRAAGHRPPARPPPQRRPGPLRAPLSQARRDQELDIPLRPRDRAPLDPQHGPPRQPSPPPTNPRTDLGMQRRIPHHPALPDLPRPGLELRA